MRTNRYALMRRAVKNFPVHSMADRTTVNHLRRRWLSSVHFLGDNWLMLREQQRRQPGEEYYV
jgi:hypothetical protein